MWFSMYKLFSAWLQKYFANKEAMCLVILLISCSLLFKFFDSIFTPLLTSIIIAYLLTNLVKFFDKHKIPHLLSVLLAFVFFIGLVILIFIWLLPLVWSELNNLFQALPSICSQTQKWLSDVQMRYSAYISFPTLQQMIASWDLRLDNIGKLAWSFSLASLNHLTTFLVYVILVPLFVFFFLKDYVVIGNWLKKFLPKKRDNLSSMGRIMHYKIGRYIAGKALEMLIIFVVSAIAFWLLDLDYVILLALLVALSVLIPYVGVTVVTIPVVIISLLKFGWSTHFLYIMSIYTIITVIDGNVLVPLLFAEVMKLHPVAILLSAFVFGSLFGFWGVFFSIPLATLIDVLLTMWPTKQQIES